MAIPLGRSLPNASRDLPGRRPETTIAVPIWSCSGWGLPCHLRCRTCGALLPHHFNLAWRQAIGGLLFLALFLESPPLDAITDHLSVEPGHSSPHRPPGIRERP